MSEKYVELIEFFKDVIASSHLDTEFGAEQALTMYLEIFPLKTYQTHTSYFLPYYPDQSFAVPYENVGLYEVV